MKCERDGKSIHDVLRQYRKYTMCTESIVAFALIERSMLKIEDMKTNAFANGRYDYIITLPIESIEAAYRAELLINKTKIGRK